MPYEDRMARDSRWALSEASLFFEGKGAVQETLRKVSAKLPLQGLTMLLREDWRFSTMAFGALLKMWIYW